LDGRGGKAPTISSVDEDIKRIEEITSIASIRTRRDKFHAHFDSDFFFNRKALQKTAPIFWDELEIILETIKKIVNKYSADYDGNLFLYKPLNINDVDIILDRLHEGKKET